MPYFITQDAEDCAGWATVKDDGEVLGCHETKQAAIDQMVALSIAEEIEPGGERDLPDNYRPALDEDVPEGRACGNCVFYDESNRQEDRAWCERWEEYVRGDYYCNAWQSNDAEEDRTAGVLIRCESDSFPGVVSPDATLFHMENGVETRRVTVNEFEVRDAEEGAGTTFVGLAAAFNSPSQPLPFVERIAPGAFTRSLQSRNEIKLFVNHDTSRVLASKRAGTLRLWESDRGLEVEADLPDTTDGRDMATLLKRGDVDSMSFGFSVPKGGDSWSDDGHERELREVRLHEVSIVTGWPAYEATTAGVRSLDGLVDATGLEADKLGEAITKLEAGETLDDDLADVLDQAVTKLRAERDDFAASLAMKQKQLDMLLARV
jgi:uncharacterized protein